MQAHSIIPSRLAQAQGDFELRFRCLFDEARGLAFPCDAEGHVLLDTLSDRARHNYFYARALTGREYAWPVVLTRDRTRFLHKQVTRCTQRSKTSLGDRDLEQQGVN